MPQRLVLALPQLWQPAAAASARAVKDSQQHCKVYAIKSLSDAQQHVDGETQSGTSHVLAAVKAEAPPAAGGNNGAGKHSNGGAAPSNDAHAQPLQPTTHMVNHAPQAVPRKASQAGSALANGAAAAAPTAGAAAHEAHDRRDRPLSGDSSSYSHGSKQDAGATAIAARKRKEQRRSVKLQPNNSDDQHAAAGASAGHVRSRSKQRLSGKRLPRHGGIARVATQQRAWTPSDLAPATPATAGDVGLQVGSASSSNGAGAAATPDAPQRGFSPSSDSSQLFERPVHHEVLPDWQAKAVAKLRHPVHCSGLQHLKWLPTISVTGHFAQAIVHDTAALLLRVSQDRSGAVRKATVLKMFGDVVQKHPALQSALQDTPELRANTVGLMQAAARDAASYSNNRCAAQMATAQSNLGLCCPAWWQGLQQHSEHSTLLDASKPNEHARAVSTIVHHAALLAAQHGPMQAASDDLWQVLHDLMQDAAPHMDNQGHKNCEWAATQLQRSLPQALQHAVAGVLSCKKLAATAFFRKCSTLWRASATSSAVWM